MVTGEQTLVLVDLADRRPRRVPDDFREPIRAFEATTSRNELRRPRGARRRPRSGVTQTTRLPGLVALLARQPEIAAEGVLFARGALVLVPPGAPTSPRRARTPITYHGDEVGELAVDGASPPEPLDRVAAAHRAVRPARLGHGRRGPGAVARTMSKRPGRRAPIRCGTGAAGGSPSPSSRVVLPERGPAIPRPEGNPHRSLVIIPRTGDVTKRRVSRSCDGPSSCAASLRSVTDNVERSQSGPRVIQTAVPTRARRAHERPSRR